MWSSQSWQSWEDTQLTQGCGGTYLFPPGRWSYFKWLQQSVRGQMFMTTKGGQIRLCHKREHTGINAAHLAYRTAVRNKTWPWIRKQGDGKDQKNREGGSKWQNRVKEKTCLIKFDILWNVSQDFILSQHRKKERQLAVLRSKSPVSFPPRELPNVATGWQDWGSVGELR